MVHWAGGNNLLAGGSDSIADKAGAGRGDLSYSFKAGLIGAPWELGLTRDGLAWQVGSLSGIAPYRGIRRVRLSFRPATLQQHRFLMEIWSAGAPKLKVISTSWRSLTDQARQDTEYRAFVTELHRRLHASGTRAEFSAGAPFVIYCIGVVVFAGLLFAFGGLVWRTLQLHEWAGASIIAGLFALLMWQLGNYFYRNRPQTYRPDAVPEQVLPRG